MFAPQSILTSFHSILQAREMRQALGNPRAAQLEASPARADLLRGIDPKAARHARLVAGPVSTPSAQLESAADPGGCARTSSWEALAPPPLPAARSPEAVDEAATAGGGGG
jgi:hypothetical protein